MSRGCFLVTQRYSEGVAQRSGAMHVAKVTNRYRTKSGEDREYVSHLLRRTFRDGGKVKHETLANLSPLPGPAPPQRCSPPGCNTSPERSWEWALAHAQRYQREAANSHSRG